MRKQYRSCEWRLMNRIWCKKSIFTTILWVLIILIPAACIPLQNEPARVITNDQSQVIEPGTPATGSDPTPTDLFSSDRPQLLIQSDFKEYRILDMAGGPGKSLEIPTQAQQPDLARDLSPSGTQILLHTSENEFIVMSLPAGFTQSIYPLASPSPTFNLELAAQEALATLPGQKFSLEAMLTAVQTALASSRMNIQWFGSDQLCLTVLQGAETSTNLFLKNLQTGSQDQLESKPGLVESYWSAPGGRHILLKKGVVFEPNVWQDDRYYLVDPSNRSAIPIPLPENVDNPSVFWISPDHIGINHQPKLVGGNHFSVLEIGSMESNLVVEGAFDGLHHQGEQTLALHQDHDAGTTTLIGRSLDGQLLTAHKLGELCFIRASVNSHQLFLNCETTSVLFNTDTSTFKTFGAPITLFALSPDSSRILLMTRDQNISLWDANLSNSEKIRIAGNPQEFLWLPDSSGFLYRTAGKLYFYDLQTESSTLLITSEFLGDYRNLNAAWIKQE